MVSKVIVTEATLFKQYQWSLRGDLTELTVAIWQGAQLTKGFPVPKDQWLKEFFREKALWSLLMQVSSNLARRLYNFIP